jgi:hypothetical protein
MKNFKPLAWTLSLIFAFAPLAQADNAVTSGEGKVKVDGLLQFWGINDTTLGYLKNIYGTSAQRIGR